MADNDRPEVPQYQPATVAYQPMDADDYANMYSQIMRQQIRFAPKILQTQIDAQTGLSQNAARLLGDTARTIAPDRLAIEQQYQPQFTAQMLSTLQQADPEYTAVHKALGANVLADLEAGYSLGPELQREVEQSIRAGQDARGNWLGAAPTAAEAFGTGSAAVNLRNQRMATAQNFQNSKSPTDFFGSLAPTSAWSPSAPIYANSSVNSGIPASIFGNVAQSQAQYNDASMRATGLNNAAMYQQYGLEWDQYGYDQAVSNGLYSSPGGSGTNPWLGAATGAMSGAAMGATVGGPYGAAIGAVGGAILGGVGSM
jgi:hypothetical protein